jgi:hypothetical protein
MYAARSRTELPEMRRLTNDLETIHNNDGFQNRPEIYIYKKSYKNVQKCANRNTGYDVKKQHIPPEMTAIPPSI